MQTCSLDLLSGEAFTVILRQEVREFWRIVVADLQSGRNVVAIGNPGLGKTSTSPYLLHLLLATGRPVVYHVRGESPRTGVYYEITPNLNGGHGIRLYQEAEVYQGTIPALGTKGAYLVIEPHLVRELPPRWIKCKFALVVSADDRHHKGVEKSGPYEFSALFRYFPLWSLQELKEARPYIQEDGQPILSNAEEVEEGVRLFGFNSRLVFSKGETRQTYLRLQREAVSQMSSQSLRSIISSGVGVISAADQLAPSSYVVGYKSWSPFGVNEVETVLLSEAVTSLVWKHRLHDLWGQLEESSAPEARYQFEEYGRSLLVTPDLNFKVRRALSAKDALIEPENLPVVFAPEEQLRVSQVDDPLAEVQRQPSGTLFYSRSETEAFVDAVLKKQDGSYVGFNFVISPTHDCKPAGLAQYGTALGTTTPFQFFYAVHSKYFRRFKTNPVAPSTAQVDVFILEVPPPKILT
jgi:hypothetical protein